MKQDRCNKCKVELKNFNYMFFVILICLSFSMLYGAWSYKSAKDIIIDNQNYEHIDQKIERQFNEWDLDRMYKLHFAFGSFFFVLSLIYLSVCIMGEGRIIPPPK